jgi:hypothetical protein
MKTKITITLLILAGAVIIWFQFQNQKNLCAEIESLHQQIAQLYADNESLSNRLADANNSKKLPDEQFNELLKLRGEVGVLRWQTNELVKSNKSPAPEYPMSSALAAKVAQLKQKLEQMPDKKIPELQFLSEKDWADAVRDADLSTEDGIRQALSKLREEAENTFLNDMTKNAMKEYLTANGNVLPSNLYQLEPYFDVPVTDAMLQRYQLVQTGTPDPSTPLVKETAQPVDDEYDSYHEISINGASGSGVNEIASEVLAAANAFAKNNNGQRPTDSSQITPYLQQPIDTAKIQKYLNQFASPNQ